MDILLDAFEQLYPLALNEGFIAYAQATYTLPRASFDLAPQLAIVVVRPSHDAPFSTATARHTVPPAKQTRSCGRAREFSRRASR